MPWILLHTSLALPLIYPIAMYYRSPYRRLRRSFLLAGIQAFFVNAIVFFCLLQPMGLAYDYFVTQGTTHRYPPEELAFLAFLYWTLTLSSLVGGITSLVFFVELIKALRGLPATNRHAHSLGQTSPPGPLSEAETG